MSDRYDPIKDFSPSILDAMGHVFDSFSPRDAAHATKVFTPLSIALDLGIRFEEGDFSLQDIVSVSAGFAVGAAVGTALSPFITPAGGIAAGIGAGEIASRLIDEIEVSQIGVHPTKSINIHADGSYTVDYHTVGSYQVSGVDGANPGFLLTTRTWVFDSNGVLRRIDSYQTSITDPDAFQSSWPDVVLPQCFPKGTLILMADGIEKPIELIEVGDMVASFDPEDPIASELTGKRVSSTFQNITDDFILLSNGLVATPGHHFVNSANKFSTLEQITKSDSKVVLADGRISPVEAINYTYSSSNKDLFERASGFFSDVVGGSSLVFKSGWKTYNFEVEGSHTYVAAGVRVHNASVFTSAGKDLTVGAVFSTGDGYSHQVNADGSITNLDTGHTTSANEYAAGLRLSALGMTRQEQSEVARAGGFAKWQTQGDGPPVPIASGKVVKAGTEFQTGDGYIHRVNADGSVTNIMTGHTVPGVSVENDEPSHSANKGRASVTPDSRSTNPSKTQEPTREPIRRNDDDDDRGSTVRGRPVVLDLDGDGVELTDLGTSQTFFDLAGDGLQHRTAWAGVGDGVLVYDIGNDAKIDLAAEIEFTRWDPTASSDLEAIRNIHDTNGDGKLTSADQNWALFKVLVTNADGTTTLKTLAELGITELGLRSDNHGRTFADGSKILGEATFVRSDGSEGKLADALFAYEAEGFVVRKTTVSNPDSSTTVTTTGFNTDGSVANTTVVTTSADGNSQVRLFDDNGDGVTDRVHTVETSFAANGARTTVFETFDGSGADLRSREVSVRNADGSSETISKDLDGSGDFDLVIQRETSSDGTLTVIETALHDDGTVQARTVTATSADGHSKTSSVDLTGSGKINATSILDTEVAGDGTRVESVTNYAGNTTSASNRIFSEVTTTSATGLTKSTAIDVDGDGDVDTTVTSIITRNATGSTTTETTLNGDGSVRSRTITDVNTSGTARSAQSDLDGNGSIDLKSSELYSLNTDGSVVSTSTVRFGDNSLASQIVSTRSSDGASRSTSIDSDGDGKVDTLTVTTSSAGNTLESIKHFASDGHVISSAVTSYTTDGQTANKSVSLDINGDGVVDQKHTETVVKLADGSSVITSINTNGDGTITLSKTITQLSADGLERSVMRFVGDEPEPSSKVSEIKTVLATGATSTTIVEYQGSDLETASTTIIDVSADRRTITTKDYVGDANTPSSVTVVVRDIAGTVTETRKAYSPDGLTIISKVTSTTTPDGLRKTVKSDYDGDGVTDSTAVYLDVLLETGNTEERISEYTGSLQSSAYRTGTTSTIVSANGLKTTIRVDEDGDADFDRVAIQETVYGASGSKTTTETQYRGEYAVVTEKLVTVTSDDGLSTTEKLFLGTSTVADRTVTTTSSLAQSGSKTAITSTTAADGTLLSKSTIVESGTGRSSTTKVNLDGDSDDDHIVQTDVQADGSVKTVHSTYDSGLSSRLTTTTTADGLSTVVTLDRDGNGSVDRSWSDVMTYDTDGTKTRVVTTTGSNNALIERVSTDTSADGLQVVTSWETDSGVSRVETRSSSINADGSTTSSVGLKDDVGSLLSETTTTTNITGSQSTQFTDSDGDGITDHMVVRVLNPDGSSSTRSMDGTVVVVGGDLYGSLGGRYDHVSGDKLSSTTTFDADGNGIVELEVAEVTHLHADGSTQTVVTKTTLGPDDLGTPGVDTLEAIAVIETSANGLEVVAHWDIDGDGLADVSRTISDVLGEDGSTVRLTSYFEGGTLKSSTSVWTRADGNLQRTELDTLGAGAATEIKTKEIVHAANGTTKEINIHTTVGGTVVSHTESTISADERTVTTRQYVGTTVVGSETTKTYEYADGAVLSNWSRTSASGAVVEKSSTTTSGDGLRKTVKVDDDADGRTDFLEESVKLSDGTYSSTATDYSSSGAVIKKKTTQINFDESHKEVLTDKDGSGNFDELEVSDTDWFASGAQRTIVETFKISGSGYSLTNPLLSKREIISVSADGSTVIKSTDINADGAIDETVTTVTLIDGSTRTTSVTNAAARAEAPPVNEILWTSALPAKATVAFHTIVEVSADGLTTTVAADYDGDGLNEHHELWRTLADGTKIGSLLDVNTAGAALALGTIVVAGRSTLFFLDTNADGQVDRWEQSLLSHGGGFKKTVSTNMSVAPVMIMAYAEGDLLRYVMTGTVEKDLLVGQSLNDKLSGGAGSDRLDGQAGDDLLIGGAGADILNGGSGFDTASYETAASAVRINTQTPSENSNDAAGDTFLSIEAIRGSSRNDHITFHLNDFFVYGGAGDDTIYAKGTGATVYGDDGADHLVGSTNGDTLIGGAGGDRIISYEGDDSLLLGDGHDLANGGDGNDFIDGGAGVDTIEGGAGNDLLLGGAGDDRLFGEAGQDTLDGGEGNDGLNGGAGYEDTFIFRNNFGDDRVVAFEIGLDRIEIHHTEHTSFASLFAVTQQDGSDTVISFDNGSSITLLGIVRTNLLESDFSFYY